jgi:hypothetical protein
MATAKSSLVKKNMSTSEKLEIGMKLVKADLIAFKKAKNSELVVMQGDKIVYIKPDELPD